MRLRVQPLASLSGLRIWHCRELWCRPVATDPIRPLAWEPPYAMGAALEKTKKKKKCPKGLVKCAYKASEYNALLQ